jgi:transcriptional regulator with XRE-family HTH domain
MRTEEQRIMLGAFVRAHRERMKPDTSGGRRRTPGLRREELAARAGIGTTWCAWIEQGRDVNASPEALSRLADALDLTAPERTYLFELAGRRDPRAPMAEPVPDSPAAVRALVEAVSHPAYGLDGSWDLCCWNPAAARLFGDWLRGDGRKNLLRYMFLDHAARTLVPDWEDRATRLLAEFRADYGRTFNDPRTRALVEQLKREDALFARAWEAQAVVARQGGRRTFRHPEDGPLMFDQHTFSPADRPDYKVVLLIPSI